MRPHALRNAVVVGHNLAFQRVIGNALQYGIFTARAELVEIVVTLTDHCLPDEKLCGDEVAETVRTRVIGTPACGQISRVTVLHDSADEQLDGIRGNSTVVLKLFAIVF